MIDEVDAYGGPTRAATYRPPPSPVIDDPVIAGLADELASYSSVETSHRWERRDADSAIARLTALADRETLLRLLGHESPVVRGHLATHVCEELRGELESLYPLLEDDRFIKVGSRCCVSGSRVGAHVAHLIGFVAAGELWLEATASEQEVARALLTRAARDPRLPDFACGAAVEALASAKVDAAEPVVRECLASEQPELVRAALSGVRLLPEADRLPALRSLSAHASPAVRARVLVARKAIDDSDIAEACGEVIAHDGNPAVRREATWALPHGSARALEAALLAARDSDQRVRDSALSWLVEEDLGAAAPSVIEDISRPDERVAVDCIGQRHRLFRPRGPGADAIARHLVALEGPLVERRRELIAEALDYVGVRRLADCAHHVRRHVVSWDDLVGDHAARTAGLLGDREAIGAIEVRLKRLKRASLEGASEGAAALGSVGSLPLVRAALRIAVPEAQPAIRRAIARLEALEEAERKGAWASIRRALRRATRR